MDLTSTRINDQRIPNRCSLLMFFSFKRGPFVIVYPNYTLNADLCSHYHRYLHIRTNDFGCLEGRSLCLVHAQSVYIKTLGRYIDLCEDCPTETFISLLMFVCSRIMANLTSIVNIVNLTVFRATESLTDKYLIDDSPTSATRWQPMEAVLGMHPPAQAWRARCHRPRGSRPRVFNCLSRCS